MKREVKNAPNTANQAAEMGVGATVEIELIEKELRSVMQAVSAWLFRTEDVPE